MSKAVNIALHGLMQHYKAFGHDCKGKGKRKASKCRRQVDRALCKGAA